jgi:hypothetical protein
VTVEESRLPGNNFGRGFYCDGLAGKVNNCLLDSPNLVNQLIGAKQSASPEHFHLDVVAFPGKSRSRIWNDQFKSSTPFVKTRSANFRSGSRLLIGIAFGQKGNCKDAIHCRRSSLIDVYCRRQANPLKEIGVSYQ